MKQAKLLFLLIATLAFASCGSDEPRYADPEAHEKTVQLNEQYGPLMVGIIYPKRLLKEGTLQVSTTSSCYS